MRKYRLKKKTKKKIIKSTIIILIVSLSLTVLGLAYFAYITIPHLDKIETFKANDKFFWAKYFYVETEHQINDDVKGTILSDKIDDLLNNAQILKNISQKSSVKRIFLISELKNEKTVSDIFMCKKCRFYGVKGKFSIDTDYIKSISSSNIVVLNDDVFKFENSSLIIMPLIMHFFPNAEIVPILISPEAKKDNLIRLKNIIRDSNKVDSLFITSMSFSEDTILALKETDNISSRRTIENFNYDKIDSISVSANYALFSFLHLMDALNYKKIEYINDNVLFFEGERTINKGTTFLAVGNVYNDADLSVLRGFKYDKNYNPKTDLSSFKNLKDIRLEKDSFFVGIDSILFDVKKDDCVDFLQNSFSIAFCKFREIENEENFQKLSEEKEKRDAVIVLIDYKDKDFNDDKKVFMKRIVDLGADIVVGRGISEVLEMENYNSSLIFYSLGDFLPESKMFSELRSNLNGAILSFDINEDFISAYLLGVNIFGGNPSISGEGLRDEFFKILISGIKSNNVKFEIDTSNAFFRFSRK